MIAVFCLCKCIHVLVSSAGLNKMIFFFFLLASHASSSDFYPNATTDWLVFLYLLEMLSFLDKDKIRNKLHKFTNTLCAEKLCYTMQNITSFIHICTITCHSRDFSFGQLYNINLVTNWLNLQQCRIPRHKNGRTSSVNAKLCDSTAVA